MSVRKHPLLRWLLAIVLMINGTVTASAWAMNLPVAAPTQSVDQAGRMPAHCADAMAEMTAAGGADEVAPPPSTHDHQQTSTNGCCAPGSCHCASSTLPGDASLIPQRAPLLRVASIAPREQRAAPAPALTRHFRPPIP